METLMENVAFQTGRTLATMNDILPVVARQSGTIPAISVIILNYNGIPWLERCLASLRCQTIFDQIEVVIADNASPDQSGSLAAELVRDWPRGCYLQNGANIGYAGGNNRAAKQARGRYLLFLNNDTWLEPNCLEYLLQEAEASGAMAATPLLMDYTDDTMQSTGGGGFDVFGLPICGPSQWSHRQEIFSASGAALLIRRDWFQKLGGFDDHFFMYADEEDLCWRAKLAGGKVILAPSAKLHHRGAASVNPNGGEKVIEKRTSDAKRFYANRNCLLVLLKNSQHLLLIMVPLQLTMLAVEAFFMGIVLRRWSFIKRAYIDAVWDCWRLRRHIFAERRRVKKFRRHSDFWMLRFLRPRLNRWQEIQNCQRHGFPKVDAK